MIVSVPHGINSPPFSLITQYFAQILSAQMSLLETLSEQCPCGFKRSNDRGMRVKGHTV